MRWRRSSAHYLDEKDHAGGFARVPDLVDGRHGGGHRGIEADGFVGAENVVVDGSRDADDGQTVLQLQRVGALKCAAPADRDQRLDAVFAHLLDSTSAHRGVEKLRGPGCPEDGAAVLDDVTDRAVVQLVEAPVDEAGVAVAIADHRHAVSGRGPDRGADGGVHSGRVSAAGQDAEPIHTNVTVPTGA
jgi:hypothetical protein